MFRLDPSRFEGILPELNEFVKEFPWGDREAVDLDNSYFVSKEKYLKLKEKDIPVAVDRSIVRLPLEMTENISKKVIDFLGSSVGPSGSILYPPKGWMGWHTNSDSPVRWRLYISYTKAESSFFRYISKDIMMTDYDEAGFNFRVFDLGEKNNPFWHCVYANDWRFSLGFRSENIIV